MNNTGLLSAKKLALNKYKKLYCLYVVLFMKIYCEIYCNIKVYLKTLILGGINSEKCAIN